MGLEPQTKEFTHSKNFQHTPIATNETPLACTRMGMIEGHGDWSAQQYHRLIQLAWVITWARLKVKDTHNLWPFKLTKTLELRVCTLFSDNPIKAIISQRSFWLIVPVDMSAAYMSSAAACYALRPARMVHSACCNHIVTDPHQTNSERVPGVSLVISRSNSKAELKLRWFELPKRKTKPWDTWVEFAGRNCLRRCRARPAEATTVIDPVAKGFMGVPEMVVLVPQNGWFIMEINGKSYWNGWFRGTHILGNLLMFDMRRLYPHPPIWCSDIVE